MYTEKDIIEEYINFSLDFCSKCIAKYEEFFPFSFYIKNGETTVIEPGNLSDLPNFNTLINNLKINGLNLIKDNQCRSFCIGYRTRVKIEGKYYDALAIFVKLTEYESTSHGRIYYYPYTTAENFDYLFDLAYYIDANN